MLPSGEITEHAVMQLGDMLQSGEIIIDAATPSTKTTSDGQSP
jgi:6-phosphogluconate dehydrogenase (decarboxylating)